jgi:transcriptional regulator with XRE-family HTH domain
LKQEITLPIGRAVEIVRDLKKISAQQLAKKIQITASVLANIENGRHNPSLVTLEKISKGLGISSATLVMCAEIIQPSEIRVKKIENEMRVITKNVLPNL